MSKPTGEKDKISILMHEYDALRQEIVSRTTHGFQLIAIGAGLFLWAMQANFTRKLWVGLVVAILALLAITVDTFWNLAKVAKRVRELEADINTRAGEKLLIWETERGGGVCWRPIRLWLERFRISTMETRISDETGKPGSKENKQA